MTIEAQVEIFNADGIEQAGIGPFNLSLRQKGNVSAGSFTAISGPNSAVGGKYSFTVTAQTPVVAIATDQAGESGAAYAFVQQAAGIDQWTITLYVSAWPFTATVYWYLFDKPVAPTENFGLQLFDALGNCTFDSNQKCMRFKQLIDWYYNSPNGYPTSITPPAGKTYAAFVRSQLGQFFIGSINTTTGDRLLNDYRVGGVGGGYDATQMTIGQKCFVGTQPAPTGSSGAVGQLFQSYGNASTDAIVIDVTNM